MFSQKVENIIDELYMFLETNKKYNCAIQNAYYREITSYLKEPNERLLALLFAKLNTQSQPKLDLMYEFWKVIYSKDAKLSSFKSFIELLRGEVDEEKNFKGDLHRLWYYLQLQKGWGPKTSALFVKACCDIHWRTDNESLSFWEDFPKEGGCTKDRLYLPVDRVIMHIFSLDDMSGFVKSNNFRDINDFLYEKFPNPKDMILWDDLWFWGFITQKIENSTRELGWNEAKYFGIFHSPKDMKSIEEIKEHSTEFIEKIDHKFDSASLHVPSRVKN